MGWKVLTKCRKDFSMIGSAVTEREQVTFTRMNMTNQIFLATKHGGCILVIDG